MWFGFKNGKQVYDKAPCCFRKWYNLCFGYNLWRTKYNCAGTGDFAFHVLFSSSVFSYFTHTMIYRKA